MVCVPVRLILAVVHMASVGWEGVGIADIVEEVVQDNLVDIGNTALVHSQVKVVVAEEMGMRAQAVLAASWEILGWLGTADQRDLQEHPEACHLHWGTCLEHLVVEAERNVVYLAARVTTVHADGVEVDLEGGGNVPRGGGAYPWAYCGELNCGGNAPG